MSISGWWYGSSSSGKSNSSAPQIGRGKSQKTEDKILDTRVVGSVLPRATKVTVHWVSDDNAQNCTSCQSVFSIMWRRHHCRLCGKVFCKNCCQEKIELDPTQFRLLTGPRSTGWYPGKKHRLCTNCYQNAKRHLELESKVQKIIEQSVSSSLPPIIDERQREEIVKCIETPCLSNSSISSKSRPRLAEPLTLGVCVFENYRKNPNDFNKCMFITNIHVLGFLSMKDWYALQLVNLPLRKHLRHLPERVNSLCVMPVSKACEEDPIAAQAAWSQRTVLGKDATWLIFFATLSAFKPHLFPIEQCEELFVITRPKEDPFTMTHLVQCLDLRVPHSILHRAISISSWNMLSLRAWLPCLVEASLTLEPSCANLLIRFLSSAAVSDSALLWDYYWWYHNFPLQTMMGGDCMRHSGVVSASAREAPESSSSSGVPQLLFSGLMFGASKVLQNIPVPMPSYFRQGKRTDQKEQLEEEETPRAGVDVDIEAPHLGSFQGSEDITLLDDHFVEDKSESSRPITIPSASSSGSRVRQDSWAEQNFNASPIFGTPKSLPKEVQHQQQQLQQGQHMPSFLLGQGDVAHRTWEKICLTVSQSIKNCPASRIMAEIHDNALFIREIFNGIQDLNSGKWTKQKFVHEFTFLTQKFASSSNTCPFNPIDPRKVITNWDLEESLIMPSRNKPILFAVDVEDTRRAKRGKKERVQLLFKRSDLRLDYMVLAMMTLMDATLKEKIGLDCGICLYSVFPVDDKCGIIEVVQGAYTLFDISNKHSSLQDFFWNKLAAEEVDSGRSVKQITSTFTKSLAFFCVFVFLLGISDRHLNNLLVRDDGRLFHIDFSAVMDDKFDTFTAKIKAISSMSDSLRSNIRVTRDMCKLLGGEGSPNYEIFKQTCQRIYDILRKEVGIISTMLRQLYVQGLLKLSLDELRSQIEYRFKPYVSDNDAKLAFGTVLENEQSGFSKCKSDASDMVYWLTRLYYGELKPEPLVVKKSK